MNIRKKLADLMIRHGETTASDILRALAIFAVMTLIGNYYKFFLVTDTVFYQVIAFGVIFSFVLYAWAHALRNQRRRKEKAEVGEDKLDFSTENGEETEENQKELSDLKI